MTEFALDTSTGILIIVLFGLFWIGFGYWLGRKNKSHEDFALAGRNVGFAFAAATAMATWVTSNTTLVAPQLTFQFGVWGMIGYSFAALGSNIDPEMNIHHAKQQLQTLSGDCLFSQNIATKPVDIDTNNGFLNALFIIDTPLSSDELKQQFNQIEEALGRDRSDPERSKKDRTIDIDILGLLDERPDVPDYLQSLTTELGLSS